MAKITLKDPGANYRSTNQIKSNNDLIEAAIENTLSRDGTGPNQMEANLDMNSNRVLNLPEPVSNSEPYRKIDIDSGIGPDITTVAISIADVSTVADDIANVNIVAADLDGSDTIGAAASLIAAGSPGLIAVTSAGNASVRSLATTGDGLSVSDASGQSGNPTLTLDNDLAALEALSGTGIAVRTASDTWTNREITVGTGLSVSNGDGVSGNIGLSLDADLATIAGLSEADGALIVGSGSGWTQAVGFDALKAVLETDLNTATVGQTITKIAPGVMGFSTPAGGGDLLAAANETVTGDYNFTGALQKSGASVYAIGDTVPITDGGTGATTAATARVALGVYDTAVADYAALKALTANDYRVVHVADLKRGGLFVWTAGDRSSNVTADTREGEWVPPASDATGASGAWQRLIADHYEAEWFGVVGDGSTDDAPALNGAIQYLEGFGFGGTLQLPSLTMQVASTVVVDSARVILRGHGMFNSVIRGATAVDPVVRFGTLSGVATSRALGIDFAVTRSGTAASGTSGISCVNVSHPVLERVASYNHGYPFNFVGPSSTVAIQAECRECHVWGAINSYFWVTNFAGVYWSGGEMGKNGFEEVGTLKSCVKISGDANDIRFMQTNMIPRRNTTTFPTAVTSMFEFENFTNATGVIHLVDVNSESVRHAFISDAASVVVNDLRISSGRIVPDLAWWNLNAATVLKTLSLVGVNISASDFDVTVGAWANFSANFFGCNVTVRGADADSDAVFVSNTCTANLTFTGTFGALTYYNQVDGTLSDSATVTMRRCIDQDLRKAASPQFEKALLGGISSPVTAFGEVLSAQTNAEVAAFYRTSSTAGAGVVRIISDVGGTKTTTGQFTADGRYDTLGGLYINGTAAIDSSRNVSAVNLTTSGTAFIGTTSAVTPFGEALGVEAAGEVAAFYRSSASAGFGVIRVLSDVGGVKTTVAQITADGRFDTSAGLYVGGVVAINGIGAAIADPNAITAYTAPTISASYTQSEVQAIADALQTLRSEVEDLRAKEQLLIDRARAKTPSIAT